MKKNLSKITSFTLALLVLFSTFSFTVEKHFCGEFLMDISYIGNTADCGMKKEMESSIKKTNCCKDEVHKIEGQDALQKNSIDEFNFEKKEFLATFIFSYKDFFIETLSRKIILKDFPPPEIHQNYQIAFQSFLI